MPRLFLSAPSCARPLPVLYCRAVVSDKVAEPLWALLESNFVWYSRVFARHGRALDRALFPRLNPCLGEWLAVEATAAVKWAEVTFACIRSGNYRQRTRRIRHSHSRIPMGIKNSGDRKGRVPWRHLSACGLHSHQGPALPRRALRHSAARQRV